MAFSTGPWQALRNSLKTAAWAFPVALTVSDCFFSIVKVEGYSMQPTLNCDYPTSSDWVLVQKFQCKTFHKYDDLRGSVVLLWAPDNPHQQLIKRLLALPGDLVLEDDVDVPMTISQGRCWIEGDNKAHSGDSRNLYGPVHLGLIEGRVSCVLWPPARWGLIASKEAPHRVMRQDKHSAVS